ncbi:glutamate receptor 2.8-like [Solanum dulcamara]|uniref:glutamate receptor 2.8-like n=1 Tax=Solanum dulcamara TaxID=45834 RepID=UPI002486321C|nr:glutamate receptor 2.8-like [Solanum dulcamara]
MGFGLIKFIKFPHSEAIYVNGVSTTLRLLATRVFQMRNPRCSFLIIFIQIVSIITFCHYVTPVRGGDNNTSAVKVDVGIILDLETDVGKVMHISILLALEDYHAHASRGAIRIVPHIRDSKKDDVEAASAAIYLLKDVQVQAIFGPQMSTQTDFVIDLGNRVKVPIISPATSPSLSVKENPYFIRGALPSSCQTKAIAAIVKNFDWREVVVIYEDSPYGTGIVPHLTDALLEISTLVSYRSVISPSANDDQILKELYNLNTKQTRVFVVHLQPYLASRLFLKAKEAGMMSSGYAWIITDVLTSLLDSVDHSVIESSMQGVLGIKPYIPRSNELNNYTKRWRKRFRQEYPDKDQIELNVFGLWAYDSITSLAEAVEKVGTTAIPKLKKPDTRENLTDLDALGTSEVGSLLIDSMRNTVLKQALTGDFRIIDGELQPFPYQIVNIVGKGERSIGFWMERDVISCKLKMNGKTAAKCNNKQLGAILWPGESTIVPRGWEIPTSGKKLRVGVPVKGGLERFIKVEIDPKTQAVTATGFCADVFKEVILSLPYALPYEVIPFPIPDLLNFPDYDDLVHKITSHDYDAVVGDVTILASRSEYVDFTLPFSESGISAVVPVRDDERRDAWIFLKPLKSELWITTGAFFVFIGFVVWVLEHRVNKEFRGPKRKQVGMIFWFSFSTLVFAHRERVTSNLTRFVLIVWVFVVLVLTSSYTASLTSMLTLQQLQPSITDLNDLIKNGEYVGYQEGSFVKDVFLKRMNFDSSKFRSYSTLEDYNNALLRGSKNGGVGAIVDELPYLRLFLNKYCRKYIMVGPTYKAAGFGFAFPKGSPLVPDVSRAVLKVMEGENMNNIIQKWFGNETDCPQKDGMAITSDSLTLDSFKGLFLIAGVSAGSALLIFFLIFLYQNREVLTTDDSIWQKLCAIAKVFDLERDNSNSMSEKPSEGNESNTPTLLAASEASTEIFPDLPSQSPEIRISDSLGASPAADGFSTTEPGTPVHQTITDTIEET